MRQEQFELHYRCPICLDIPKKSMRSSVCPHRFCQKCIIDSLRLSGLKCPICTKFISSKRVLFHDADFDELMAVVQAMYKK